MSYLEPILVHPVRREIFCDTSAQIFFTILKLRHNDNDNDDEEGGGLSSCTGFIPAAPLHPFALAHIWVR